MAAQTTDEDLLLALRDGDLAAFDVLYGRYERRLFGYLLRFVGDRTVAEDLLQDVLLTIIGDRTYDPARGRFAAWVFAVARNRVRMHGRQAAKDPVELPDEPAEAATRSDTETTGALVRSVRDAMSALPAAQQELLVLKQVGELSYREIAELHGVHEGTVKSRLHAAMKAFRQRLAQLERELGENG